MKAYRWLLRLLPSYRRGRYGEEMAHAFQHLQAEERQRRGLLGVVVLWVRELTGLLRFALRERVLALWIATEMRWAWRGIRGRGWSAVLAVGLVALAISANALVFAAADSIVFRRMLYPNADRLVEIRHARQTSMTADVFREWSQQTDLLAGIERYSKRSIFLTTEAVAEHVRAANVGPDIFRVLGVSPRWGRGFIKEDAGSDEPIVVISEDLASSRFGHPAQAVGKRLETTDRPFRVIGVMARSFRFPDASVQVWRAMDAQTQPGAMTIASLAPGRTPEGAAAVIAQRGAAIAGALGLGDSYRPEMSSFYMAGAADQQRRLFLMLLAAAACLLLTACANVASLELASAVNRGRRYAVQLALGASRSVLTRVALLESACLAASAFLLALICTHFGARALANMLPERFSFQALNPIDVDARTIGFMALVALGTWVISALPVLFYAFRASVAGLLKIEGRSASTSRGGATLRRLLTTFEVAMAVLLLVGSVMYVRTYSSLLRLDKGFDSTALAVLDVTVPPQMLAELPVARQELLERVRALPGVVAATRDSPPQNSNTGATLADLEVDGTLVKDVNLYVSSKMVQADYFQTMRIPLRAGRQFEPSDPPTNAIIDDGLARRLWPNGAVGGTVLLGRQLLHVVGVVSRIRTQEDGLPGRAPAFVYYTLAPPPPPPVVRPIAATPRPRTLPDFAFFKITVRLDSASRSAEFLRQVRSMTPKFALKVDMVDDLYARWAEETLLATRIVSAFGLFAFVVAMAGVYGVMAYLVSGRSREIGIRMTLGADRQSISSFVLGSSMRLVVTGALLGAVGAFAASRWVESQLFGVSPSDPSTYVLVTLLVTATAALATWHPARQAARVDPAITLRAE